MHNILGYLWLSCLFLAGCGNQIEPLAKILVVNGKVEARLEVSGAYTAAQTAMQLKHQSAVRTEKNSNAVLEDIARKGTIKIAPNSYYEVRAGNILGYQGSGKAVFDVEKKTTEIKVETPYGHTAVLGTKFGHFVSSDTFELWVEEGQVEFTASNGTNQKVSAMQKIQWKVKEGPLPAPTAINLLEAEEFFGNEDESFKFNNR